jgi:hypothetical protein
MPYFLEQTSGHNLVKYFRTTYGTSAAFMLSLVKAILCSADCLAEDPVWCEPVSAANSR